MKYIVTSGKKTLSWNMRKALKGQIEALDARAKEDKVNNACCLLNFSNLLRIPKHETPTLPILLLELNAKKNFKKKKFVCMNFPLGLLTMLGIVQGRNCFLKSWFVAYRSRTADNPVTIFHYSRVP